MLRQSGIALVGAAGVMAALLSGCSHPARDMLGGFTPPLTLRDGTQCAVLDGDGSGDVDCDWYGKRLPATNKDPHTNSGTTIIEVTLRDGTSCAIMDAASAKAVSCAWKRPKQNPTGADPHGDSGTSVVLVYTDGNIPCAVIASGNDKAIDCNYPEFGAKP